MNDAIALQTIILLSVTLVAAITDVTTGMIYNWLTFPAIISGIFLGLIHDGMTGFEISLIGAIIGGGALFIPFIFGIIGGGDVKLMSAVGALMGPKFVIETLLVSLFLGALISTGLIITRGKFRQFISWYVDLLKTAFCAFVYKGVKIVIPKNPGAGTAPFGPSIFIAALITQYFNVLDFMFGW